MVKVEPRIVARSQAAENARSGEQKSERPQRISMNNTYLAGKGLSRLRARIGPGLIFAAAAVGTSHIVQSTRAGAGFGLTLGILILLVCVLKYPLFRFAADYAASTGENLVRGYGRRGRVLVLVMFITSAIEAVAAMAGVSLVSASIGQWIFGTRFDPVNAAISLLVLTSILVSVGRYRVIESIAGILVVLFSLLTLITTVASLSAFSAATAPVFPAFPLNSENWSFAIAISGWMPIGNTAAIMLAAWILAKRNDTGRSVTDARFDFNLGYLASVVLALCFLLIGAAVLHGSGEALPGASGPFVTTFVGLYTRAIGDWSSALVSVAALAVMLSTLLAIVDGFPRMMSEFAAELTASRGEDSDGSENKAASLYFPAMIAVVTAASALLFFFFSAFATFIDIVTFTGFLAAPVVAWANQLVICGANVPVEHRPGAGLIYWNRTAVVVLSMATLGYLYLRWI
jgi:Mn2+/Fe2+ NRAMP family transporter